MKYFVVVLSFVMCCMKCVAQTYIEPVFDRADVPSLHINKIEVTKDTTFVYCTYTAEAGSWARISKNTYLYNSDTQEKFPLLQSHDLPFSPQKRKFLDGGTCQILLCFSGIGNTTRLDFIEDPDGEAFNIYRICLTNTFNTSYNKADLKRISEMSSSFDTEGDTIQALQYKEKEKTATAYIYGIKSEQLLIVVFDLCDMYEKYGLHQKANDEKKKIFDYIDTLDDNLEKWQLLSSLANVFSHRCDFSTSLKYRLKAVEIGKTVWSDKHPKYATSLHELSKSNYQLGNYEEAIRKGTEALEIRKKILGTKHPDYATALSNLAECYFELGNYEEAMRLGTETMQIRNEVFGTENSDYAIALSNLAKYYSALGKYEDAIRIGTEALEIAKRMLGTEHLDYALSLINLAECYSDYGSYEEAIQLGIEALEIRRRLLGSDHSDYATALNDLAVNYAYIGNYREAIRYGTETAKIKKGLWGTEHSDYATALDNLAAYYAFLGNYVESIRLGTEVMEKRKRLLGTEHPNYARSLANLAGYYCNLGDYRDAIRLGTEAMEIRKRLLGTEHPDYVLSLNNLAMYYSDLGDYEKALSLGVKAMEVGKRLLGTEHPDYALFLGNLATYYEDLGDYEKALSLEIESMEIIKKVFGTEHPEYAIALSNLAHIYSDLGYNEEAMRLSMESMEITKKVHGTEHPDYAYSLGNLSGYYREIGNYGEAMHLSMESVEITKKVHGTEHPDYAYSLGRLAGCYREIGDLEEAIRIDMEVMEIIKKVLGTEHPNYAQSLGNLAGCYREIGNYREAYLYYKRSIEDYQSYILKNITNQSSHLKEKFWRKYENAYISALPSYVYKYKNAESISELYEKTCLFAKGLLLNSDIELRRLILESGDSILIDKYNALSTNISIYNKLIEKPINERFMNADSLNNIIQQQEMELARESKVYGDYTRNLTSTWKDVQNHLGTDDIAIEFIDFPILGTDSIMYAALTLKKDYESPHMVTLFEKKHLMAIPDSSYYTWTSTYDLVWKPLEEELKNVNNIYFAPSGELHRIGIEYVPVSRTEIISDKYSLHRLSSTRQLALIQDDTKGEKSILYGGINYDESSNDTQSISTSSVGGVRGIDVKYRSNVDSLLLRSSYEYLEGTKREVDQIADQMKQHQIYYQYYSGSDGSEESFKKLDGTRPKVMHIATHGFYLTEEEARQSNFAHPYMELMMGGNQRTGRPLEDKPMTRSGLLFSGCNHAIHHEHIPDGVEDGVLTAQEISTLDLRGLDLVVLSACQTALGDIASGEGVFGLQRGFKKAGAKTILMSIDKVDDEATRILMVEFYNNLMSGKSKYQSLKDAQKYLREYDNRKYDNPKYWASFIMLDGLD